LDHNETNNQQVKEEENLAARRAAVEAIEIGREMLMMAAGQNEQIERADRHADDSQYALDKSSRLLRGMTWSGWVANKFSKEVSHPTLVTPTSRTAGLHSVMSVSSVQDAPPSEEFQSAFQAIQNYRCNLLILEKCETAEQQETCDTVCDSTHEIALKELAKLKICENDDSLQQQPLRNQLASDLSALRNYQNESLANKTPSISPSKEAVTIFPTTPKIKGEPTNVVRTEEDEHLLRLSNNLGELNAIGLSMSQMMVEQHELIDSVTQKSDIIMDKSKLVTRKAHKLVERRTWSRTKKKFTSWISIQHMVTGNFLAVSKDGSPGMVQTFHPDASVFGMWKRQGSVFGLQHRYTKRWLGQTLLGYLMCTASSFGNREEWDTNGDDEQTQLLCVCANWGVGGYMMLQKGNLLSISGSGLDVKNAADFWCMAEVEQP